MSQNNASPENAKKLVNLLHMSPKINKHKSNILLFKNIIFSTSTRRQSWSFFQFELLASTSSIRNNSTNGRLRLT